MTPDDLPLGGSMARKNSIFSELFKMKQEKEKAAEEARLKKEAERDAKAADAAQKTNASETRSTPLKQLAGRRPSGGGQRRSQPIGLRPRSSPHSTPAAP